MMRSTPAPGTSGIWWTRSLRLGTQILLMLVMSVGPEAAAAVWNGSMRLDFQASPGSGGYRRDLLQQYYVRVSDRLFYKNQLAFVGSFNHRGRQGGQPADFQPRYELSLSSYGYGGQLVYEPHTQKQAGINADEDVSRRWRGAIFVQPDRWPRFTGDFLRARRSQTSQGTGRENWNSYQLAWQPGPNILALAYSHQKRTSQGGIAELVEVYRATASTERNFPMHHRLNFSYNFDRTWTKRSVIEASAQDQHSASVNLVGDPLPTLNWTAQYSGRFLHVSRPGATAPAENPTDHLGAGAVTWTPVRVLSTSISRYVERTGARVGQGPQRTDYWQGRATAEGQFYRQMRILATVYRIYYSGAPRGLQYDDAYFLALRGLPFKRVDWSAEMTLGDRHGRQAERFGGAANIFARLQPLVSAQMQIGYTSILGGLRISAMRVTEESFNTNLQYTVTSNLGLSAAWSVRHSRILKSKWTPTWTMTGTYRWPAFASLGFSYSEQPNVQPVGVTTPQTGSRPSTFLTNLVFWLGPNTTLNTQYTRQRSIGGQSNQNWGVGISTSF